MPEDDALIQLARVVRVEAHRRKSKTGKTENVDSYLRKILDLFGGVNDKTRRGTFLSDQHDVAANRKISDAHPQPIAPAPVLTAPTVLEGSPSERLAKALGVSPDSPLVRPRKSSGIVQEILGDLRRGEVDVETGKPVVAHSTEEAVAALKNISLPGNPDGAGTPQDPISVGGDLDLALRLLADGKHVRLAQPEEVTVLLDKMADWVAKVKAGGGAEPKFNLCSVTVQNTNLFCADSKGVPRAKMPQFSGFPVPGSPAAAKVDSRGKANIGQDFRDALAAMGVPIFAKTVPANTLRATQSELNGSAVAPMVEAMRSGAMKEAPIFVTRDGYVIDGHHRWAAKVVLDSEDNELGSITMPVEVVDMDIGAALDFANTFAQKMGIKQRAFGVPASAKDAEVGPQMTAVKKSRLGPDGVPHRVYFDTIFGPGAAEAPVGEVRVWDGKRYQKRRNGDWTYVGSDLVAASAVTPNCCAPTQEDRSMDAIIRLSAALIAAQAARQDPLEGLEVRLAGVTRVDAYKRRGDSGKTEHVQSYLRKVLESFGGGADADTKRAAFVDRYSQITAERGQVAGNSFLRGGAHVADAPKVPVDKVGVDKTISTLYAPTKKIEYPKDRPTAQTPGWGMQEQPDKSMKLGMSADTYHAHLAKVTALVKAFEHLATDLVHGKIDPRDPKGKRIIWNPDRVEAHNVITNDLLAKALAPGSPVKRERKAVMSGGLGGAGKSTTLGRNDVGVNESEYVILNPDLMKEELIKRGMAPQVEGLQPMEAAGLLHEESSHLALELARKAQAQGLNVIWDITMASQSSVQDRLKVLQGNGYDTKAIFVDIPIEMSVDRALGRHKRGVEQFMADHEDLGGRFVNPKHIRANQPEGDKYYSKNRETFEALRSQFYDWQVWDTSKGGPENAKRVAALPVGSTAVWSDGKTYVKISDTDWRVKPD